MEINRVIGYVMPIEVIGAINNDIADLWKKKELLVNNDTIEPEAKLDAFRDLNNRIVELEHDLSTYSN